MTATLARPKTMKKLLPQTFDLAAHYEPRADFALTANVRRALEDLSKKHSRMTFMTGRHSGRPELRTDIKGISVGTRIELSRLVFRKASLHESFVDALQMFKEADQLGVASGPLERITLSYPKHLLRPDPRARAAEAFTQVFGSKCCFFTTHNRLLEMGQVVEHQTLIEHLFESGPYHSDHIKRVEAVRSELQKQPGRYENHKVIVRPQFTPGEHPQVEFCYSGDEPDNLVEVAMRQKASERLRFITSAELAEHADRYVSLSDYEEGARRYGRLWVLQGDLVRNADRQRFAVIHLFFDAQDKPLLDRAFTWQELYERMRDCDRINRATRNSPSFLDLALRSLFDAGFIWTRDGKYQLAPGFEHFKHVTFYDLGSYDRRLNI